MVLYYINMYVLSRLLLFDEVYGYGAHRKQYACYDEHGHLAAANHLEQYTATSRSYNLRQADGAVEQAQVGADMISR